MRGLGLLLLAVLGLAILLRVDFFVTVAYVLVVLFLLARLWVRRASRAVTVVRRHLDHAYWGDQVDVTLGISNSGRLPIPWMHVHESVPAPLRNPAQFRRAVSLGGRDRRTIHYRLDCRQRGYYALGPLTATVGDLHGMVSETVREEQRSRLVVYPKILPLDQLGLPTRSPLAVLPARYPLFEDPSRVVGVRDYQAGDSPRRMHWSASASSGRLLVKRYQPAIARETVVCLDLDRAGYPRGARRNRSELAVTVAASLAHHIAIVERQPVGLLAVGEDPLVGERRTLSVPVASERTHLMAVLEVLARVRLAAGEPPFRDVLRRASADLPWGASLAVVTPRHDPDTVASLLALHRLGFAVTLVVVADPAETVRVDGVPVRIVEAEADLGALA